MVDTRRMLDRSRRRAIGGILQHCENAEWYCGLSRAERDYLREKVLSSFAAYHDVVLDIVRSFEGDPDGVTNMRALELLEEIHGLVRGHTLREVEAVTIHGGGESPTRQWAESDSRDPIRPDGREALFVQPAHR